MKTTWLIVIIFILAIALAGVIGYLVASKSKTPKLPKPSESLTQGQPISPATQDLNSPQNDKTYFTSSTDPKSWPVGSLVAEKASVPDIIELSADIGSFKKGDLLVYYVDFATVQKPGEETLSVVVSSDKGKTWNKKQTVTVTNKPNKGAPVDPSVVQLSDGTLRLYFFGSEVTSGDPASAKGTHKVYSATSKDSVNFTAEQGVRFEDEDLTDPEVVFFKNINQWFMYYSLGQKTGLAVSSDGLVFEEQQISGGEVGGVPGAVVTDDELISSETAALVGVRLYGCGKGGIASALAFGGLTFKQDSNDVLGGKVKGVVCDPAVVRSSDGTYYIVYKQKDVTQQQPGGPKPL